MIHCFPLFNSHSENDRENLASRSLPISISKAIGRCRFARNDPDSRGNLFQQTTDVDTAVSNHCQRA